MPGKTLGPQSTPFPPLLANLYRMTATDQLRPFARRRIRGETASLLHRSVVVRVAE